MDTVEELLMVRGITPDYFFGHPEKTPEGSIVYRYGLARCFTVLFDYQPDQCQFRSSSGPDVDTGPDSASG